MANQVLRHLTIAVLFQHALSLLHRRSIFTLCKQVPETPAGCTGDGCVGVALCNIKQQLYISNAPQCLTANPGIRIVENDLDKIGVVSRQQLDCFSTNIPVSMPPFWSEQLTPHESPVFP